MSVERGLETGFFFLLMIGGSLSTSSGGLDGSCTPVERKRSLAATGLRRGMEDGVYGADGALEGDGELEYRNVTELSTLVGGLRFRDLDSLSGEELQSLLFDWLGDCDLGDTDEDRLPAVAELSSLRLEPNLWSREQNFGGEEECVFLKAFAGEGDK